MRGRNSTLCNSCAMTLTTSVRHHRVSRSLILPQSSTMSNRTCFELAVKMITASVLTGVRHSDLWRRECRFRQAACLTIAQRFSALADSGHSATVRGRVASQLSQIGLADRVERRNASSWIGSDGLKGTGLLRVPVMARSLTAPGKAQPVDYDSLPNAPPKPSSRQ